MENLTKLWNSSNGQSTDFNEDEIDLSELRNCESHEDCPVDSTCIQTPNTTFTGKCFCVVILEPLKKDKQCSELAPVEKRPDATGVIALPGLDKIGTKNIKDQPTTVGASSHNQTTSLAKEDNTFLGQALALKIFIPLAAILIICVILTVVVVRHFRLCDRKKKRSKTPVVKASEDIQLLDRMNMVNKNPTYFGTSVNTIIGSKVHIVNIPIERIKLLDAVGEGAFGQVFKGEMTVPDGDASRHIAVKVLKEGVSNEAREDFEREVEIMSAFDHDNILELLGIVTPSAGDTPYMIFEYMVHGDLAELLRKHDPSVRGGEPGYSLQKTDLIDVATQIANGMNYLTSQHFVHRDLATRNCLVGEGLVVKISDFGMARDIYTCDYYRIGGSRMLPVRWMSPEAVKWGRFTTDSDIWAYGVVLWEIFNYGRQPYYGHSNEEVIRFLDEGILLQRPDECPSTVYHVMLGCWKLDPKERMQFVRIHKYLVEYSKQISRSTHTNSVDLEKEYEIPV